MALSLILILAFLLRLPALNQSLWLDEAVSALLARDLTLGQLWAHFSSADFHPPLHSFLLWGWGRLFGWSEISLRFPSLLFSVGVVYFALRLGESIKLGKASLGFWPAILLAVNPLAVYYAQEARPYSLAAFLTLGTVYFWWRFWQSGCFSFLLPFFLFGLLYTDYYGLLVWFSLNLCLFLFARHRFFAPVWWGSQLAVGSLFIPWLPTFFRQLAAGQSSALSLPAWSALVNLSFWKALPLTLVKFLLGRIVFPQKTFYYLLAAGVSGTALWLLGRAWRRYSRQSFFRPLLFWWTVPLLLAWLLSFKLPTYQPFSLLLLLPGFYFLLVLGLSSLKPSCRRLGLIFFLVLDLCLLGFYEADPYYQREDWRGTVAWLDRQPSPKKALLPSATSVWPYRYYAGQDLLPVGEGIRPVNNVDLEKLTDLPEKVFYLRYLVPLFDPEETIARWLEANGFAKVEETSFNQIPVWVYQK